MAISKLDKVQALKIIKAAGYIAVSAALDALIAASTGTTFGTLAPLINIALVGIKQLFTKPRG